jgi:hypothetical protein
VWLCVCVLCLRAVSGPLATYQSVVVEPPTQSSNGYGHTPLRVGVVRSELGTCKTCASGKLTQPTGSWCSGRLLLHNPKHNDDPRTTSRPPGECPSGKTRPMCLRWVRWCCCHFMHRVEDLREDHSLKCVGG